MTRRVLIGLGSFFISFLAWLAFVDEISPSEAAVGAGAAVLAVWADRVVRHGQQPHFWPHARWFLQLWRIPWDILNGCWITIVALLRREDGLLHEVPFEPGGDDRHSVARRAVAIAFTGISPNSMIVGIDSKRRVMLVHMADHGPVPYIARYLGEAR